MNISDSYTLRRRGLSVLNGNWQTALMVTFAAGLLGLIQNTIQIRLDASSFFVYPVERTMESISSSLRPYSGILTLLAVLQVILSPALYVGMNTYFILLHKSENPPFSLLFSRLNSLFRCFALFFLMGVFIALWSLLFIIPGIVAAFRYSMAPFLMAEDPDMGALDAIQKSKEMMNGHKGRLFSLLISFIGWWFVSMIGVSILYSLLGIIGTALGLFASLVLQVYVNSSVAAFYLELTGRRNWSEPQAEGRVE